MIEVQGNGKIVSKEMNVSTFIRLHLGCTGIIELHQGDEEKVSIEADENLIEYFVAANAGRTLYVATESTLRKPIFTKCLIRVYLRQLNFLYVRNVNGNVICPNTLLLSQPLEVKVQSTGDTELNLAVPSLKILCQAHGNNTLKGRCEKLHIKNQGYGDFDSSQMLAGELSIKNQGNGNVKLRADKSIRLIHYGNGYMHYYGNAVVEDVKQYGNGEIKHLKEQLINNQT